MSNPYHDAEGKFCSKGEMRAAIDRAFEVNDLAAYHSLKTDFDAAVRREPLVIPDGVEFTHYEFGAENSNGATSSVWEVADEGAAAYYAEEYWTKTLRRRVYKGDWEEFNSSSVATVESESFKGWEYATAWDYGTQGSSIIEFDKAVPPEKVIVDSIGNYGSPVRRVVHHGEWEDFRPFED